MLPGATVSLALIAFGATGKPARIRKSEIIVHNRARVQVRELRGHKVAVYEWFPQASATPQKSPVRTVLLVHGWRSRASRFGPLIEQLTLAGHRVLSFDAPRHGNSRGAKPSVINFTEVALELTRDQKGPVSVVGHSLGALAALTVTSKTTQVERAVSIAGPATASYLRDAFMQAVQLPTKLRHRFSERIATAYPTESGTIFTEFDATKSHPKTNTPTLVIHDVDDREVVISEAERVPLAHQPESQFMRTTGLGHNRVLSNREVIDRIVGFV
ncbi:alpha/beta fold hydrolase [Leucobacter coleopterorum]|uniref:Alpha/beta fold hydrolase n=1 Tax=Leucobacter coleopterorum TaxID=2714933 RepID=A0ABX6JXS4_9MICO|nr:alpha/beta fold hydrolase [Leucobacter coleopterorum]